MADTGGSYCRNGVVKIYLVTSVGGSGYKGLSVGYLGRCCGDVVVMDGDYMGCTRGCNIDITWRTRYRGGIRKRGTSIPLACQGMGVPYCVNQHGARLKKDVE